ncbi:membrane protein [Methylocystis echinoides]|uniref:Membrane protein n=1 Tax=Methylocystis echinoides TaxID=29468 RepID=A0A9W6GTT3_9HYPH|nr:membrane protein [Methylocystis echinoides]
MLNFLRAPTVAPILLLILSNLFMTTAWYGHLKFPRLTMPQAIAMGWLIALIEYCLAVPANRIGYGAYSAAQLKTIQEVITLVIFMGFSFFVLGEAPSWRTLLGFALIAAGAFLVFQSK